MLVNGKGFTVSARNDDESRLNFSTWINAFLQNVVGGSGEGHGPKGSFSQTHQIHPKARAPRLEFQREK